MFTMSSRLMLFDPILAAQPQYRVHHAGNIRIRLPTPNCSVSNRLGIGDPPVVAPPDSGISEKHFVPPQHIDNRRRGIGWAVLLRFKIPRLATVSPARVALSKLR